MSEPARPKVLVVDDEVELMRALRDALTSQGFDVVGVSDPRAAAPALAAGGFDLLLTDLMMPGMDGIAVLKSALETDPDLTAILMTGHGTIPTAVEAMKAGAYDYLLKPFKLQSILPTLRRGLEVRRLKRENGRLRQVVERLSFESTRLTLVGGGPAMRRVGQLIEKVAPTDATVLVRGPSGAGKELVARAVHHNSRRTNRPLITINCAAMQESLLESELFGHERGSFTGADRAKPGLFELAEGGTLFIDEVAEMAPGMQAKFLRVLESGHFRRVGGTVELHADVRVIAATNKPLEDEQKAGRFREDLFYRLNVFAIPVPPLRDRPEDIPALVGHFLTTRPVGPTVFRIDPAALAALVAYPWPGNVRELANVLERAQILADGPTITQADLPECITAGGPVRSIAAPPVPVPAPGQPALTLRDQERVSVAAAMAAARGNKVRAARALGVSRRALYRLIDKHRLDDRPADPAAADEPAPPTTITPTE
jgi:DNA-binding NtrC family response regulator